MRLRLKSKNPKYAMVLPLDGGFMRAIWLNVCVGLIWESASANAVIEGSARLCNWAPSQRQVFRLIRAKQNRQKADANNNNYNTSASCGRQPGISRRSDRVLEWQRLCLKFDGENYGEDQCWTFRVQINISFKSLFCSVWYDQQWKNKLLLWNEN